MTAGASNQRDSLKIKEEHGSLRNSELVSVSWDRDSRQLQLACKFDTGPVKNVALAGVHHFRVVDFASENCVHDLHSSDVEMLEARHKDLSAWMTSLESGRSRIQESALFELTKQVDRGELIIFYMEPRYGASVACLCEQVTIEEMSANEA